MSLRTRLALTFGVVALLTAAAVALAAPAIVGRGFAAALAGEAPGRGPGTGGNGSGTGASAGGQGNGMHFAQVQQETVVALVAVALGAAGVATLLGVVLAGRITGPLTRVEAAAAAVARGELEARSGVAARRDEIGRLARSFDSMAGELAAQEAARRRFFADVGHELKTPLAVIEATVSAVVDGVYEHDDAHLRTIRDQARQLSRIVDDLRTVSLADAGALPLARDRVDVLSLLDQVAAALRARSTTTRVEVVAPAAGGTGLVVDADADRLRQVVGVLGDNALRHGAEGTWIRLEAAAADAGARVVITVADGGPGIADADLSRVFDRFWQADESRDRAAGTSGLGLAIARAIVEAHGGSIRAGRDAGGGAAFTLELPAG